MIEPTVGRVVWFHPNAYQVNQRDMAVSSGDNPQPLAALVTFVHSARMVNLSVFDHNGAAFPVSSVRLLQDDDTAADGEFYAEWMPYQIGQAKKHEAAPTIGRTVLYRLTADDVMHVSINLDVHDSDDLAAGDVVPLLISRVFPDASVSGMIFFDGDHLHVHGVVQGDQPGTWSFQ